MKLLLGITGGIAAYKTPELVRALRQNGDEVQVVLTGAARDFVGVTALHALSERKVLGDGLDAAGEMDHIRLAEWAELMLVAPATANTLSKLAAGFADNLLSSLALLFEKRLIVAPAMNTFMWQHPAIMRNCQQLRADGVRFIDVTRGQLACGTVGPGRMADVSDIVAYMQGLSAQQVLRGKKVLISSGPTLEKVDSVRVLTNRSSGKMGAALARAAKDLGAEEVTVVSGPVEATYPLGATVHWVESAQQMYERMHAHFGRVDICICAAAVADFKPQNAAEQKISRSTDDSPVLRLTANPDIAASLGKAKQPWQRLVCFALEDSADTAKAREKLRRKNADLLVLNVAAEAIGSPDSTIYLLNKHGHSQQKYSGSKYQHALRIYQRVVE